MIALAVLSTSPATAGSQETGDPEETLRAAVLDGWPVSPAPTHDPGLDEVARAVAQDVLGGSVRGEEGRGFTTVQTRLWEHGGLDPSPTFAAVIFDGTLAAESLLAAVADVPDLPRHDHVGLGLVGEGEQRCAVVVLVQRWLHATAVPDWAPRSDQVLSFEPRGGLEGWRVDVLAPGARCLPVTTTMEGEQMIATFRLGADPGVYRVEVVARDGRGRPVLAGIGVGTVPGKVRAPPDPEGYLGRWIDLERSRYGLEGLQRHETLDALARVHAEGIRDGQTFGHGAAGHGPVDRIRSAGVPFSVALENVGRASTLDWVHTLVMASPSHRGNLLHPRLTHVGLGAIRVESLAWFVTEDFVRLLAPLDLPLARQQIQAALDEGRTASGLEPLSSKRALTRVAERWCAEVAGATELTPDQVAALTEDVRFHLDDTERVVADLLVVDDPADVTWFPQLADPAFDQAGLALHQPPEGGRITVLVVLVARSTGS